MPSTKKSPHRTTIIYSYTLYICQINLSLNVHSFEDVNATRIAVLVAGVKAIRRGGRITTE